MEEAAENGKESSHSAHAIGINVYVEVLKLRWTATGRIWNAWTNTLLPN